MPVLLQTFLTKGWRGRKYYFKIFSKVFYTRQGYDLTFKNGNTTLVLVG
jgi:hypothetical protein